MIATMAKKRGPKGSGRTGTPLTVYLPPEHRRLLELLVAKSRRTLTNEVVVALEMLGEREGLWPLPADDSDQADEE
jgi:hypothetical protein